MKPALVSLALGCCLLIPSTIWAGAGPDAWFNIRSYGAKGDARHLDHPAINKAIAAAAKVGGGTVLVPAGTYLCGSIHLTNNINLHLEPGAVILGAPQDLQAYDPTEAYTLGGYQDGGHCFFHNSLIWGENLTNVFITGNGTINGGGVVRSDKELDSMVRFDHFDPPQTQPAPPLRLGNKAVALKSCRNVVLRDITILHGGHFAVLATGCDGLTVDNVTMDTDRDGIDIDCCRNAVVSNCRVNSPNDDGICLKSSYALGRPVATENLTIVNCQVSGFVEGSLVDGTMKPHRGGTGRIKFGTEASGGFRNCAVANCTFRSCRGLALEEVDGALMDNIVVNNLAMMDVVDYAIYITTGKRNRTPNLTTTSRARHILISNVVAEGVGKDGAIQLMGLQDEPLEGIRLENIRIISTGGGTAKDADTTTRELGRGYPEPGKLGIMPAYGLFARHVRDLELASVSLSFENDDLRPAMFCEDINGLEIDDFKAQLAPGVIAGKLNSVKDVVVRNSPVLEGLLPK